MSFTTFEAYLIANNIIKKQAGEKITNVANEAEACFKRIDEMLSKGSTAMEGYQKANSAVMGGAVLAVGANTYSGCGQP